MVVTHRTVDGRWTYCPKSEMCALPFHFPGMTPAKMGAVPEPVLWALLEVLDPPVIEADGTKRWLEHYESGRRVHRAYDLPALITPDGSALWYNHGQLHRVGAPAMIGSGGSLMWVVDGRPVEQP